LFSLLAAYLSKIVPQNLLLTERDLTRYAEERGLNIRPEDLEYFEELGLLPPLCRLKLPIVEERQLDGEVRRRYAALFDISHELKNWCETGLCEDPIKTKFRPWKEYMVTQVPQLSGLWHEDETMLQCKGRSIWFWEMIDEDTKFMVASHISGTRSMEDTIAIFQKGFDQSKVRPKAVFVDGSHVYSSAFNKVFWTMRKDTRPELVQRVGIRARETNNIVERLHGTLKDRTKPMRGLKSFESTKLLLEGYAVHYNCVRPHQSLGGKTPAQAARMEVPSNWKGLIDQAIKQEAELLVKILKGKEEKQELKVISK